MSSFERIVLWGSTAVVALSGIAFAILKYLFTTDDPFAVVNHPWQPFFLKLHVLSAPVLVFGVGVVFLKHIWRQWRSGTPAGRRTGAVVFVLLLPMAATGYLIQTVTGSALLRWLVAIHIVAGCAYVLAIAGHQFRASLHARTLRRREAAVERRRAS